MAIFLIRSSILKTIKRNLRGNFRNLNCGERQCFCLNSKPGISKITVQQRSLNWWNRFIGKQSEQNLKILDQISSEVQLIYRHDSLDNYLKWMHLALCVMSGVLVALVVFKLDKGNLRTSLLNEGIVLPNESSVLPKISDSVDKDALIFLFAFCLCSSVFYGLMKRIPVRIYKVPRTERYIFICNAGIPFNTRKLLCKRGECVKVDSSALPSFLPCENIYSISNKLKVFLFDDNFRVPADFNVLLGLQEDYED